MYVSLLDDQGPRARLSLEKYVGASRAHSFEVSVPTVEEMDKMSEEH
jgi:hypothetical protein